VVVDVNVVGGRSPKRLDHDYDHVHVHVHLWDVKPVACYCNWP
jgi:hypothetical protein